MFMEHRFDTQLSRVVSFNPTISRQAPPLKLRQLRRTLPCGVDIIGVALQVSKSGFTYTLVALPGFEGGGRDTDGSMLPRAINLDYTPKVFNTESQVKEAVWPPLQPTVRLINGREYDGWQLPETATTRRLERTFSALEPLLRQLCNLLQAKLAKGRRKQVSYAVLIDRINHVLADA